jgi:hypothetical protein
MVFSAIERTGFFVLENCFVASVKLVLTRVGFVIVDGCFWTDCFYNEITHSSKKNKKGFSHPILRIGRCVSGEV